MAFQGYWAPSTTASRPWAGCRCSAASCTTCRSRKTAPCAPISSSAPRTSTSPSRKPSASWPPPWTGAATPNCSNTTRLRGGFTCRVERRRAASPQTAAVAEALQIPQPSLSGRTQRTGMLLHLPQLVRNTDPKTLPDDSNCCR